MISAPAGPGRLTAIDELWRVFVANLPAADMNIEGLSGRILRGDGTYVIFMAAEQDVLVPAHHHGAQWGVVLEGEMELTIRGETRNYGRGDVHYIPAGVEHTAILRAGWKAIYMFGLAA
jgi:mannose-6-phosphate isomerase-like protein (cupin superfamily)